MTVKFTPLSRRTLLRGSGVAMALPLLEVMQPTPASGATTTATPMRVAFFYIPNGVVQSAWHPQETGRNFKLSPTLEPLAKVREKISVFTHLDRQKVPGTDGHAQAGACWLSSAAPHELSPAGYPLKTTIDQIIASHVGDETAFRSLELSCNPYQDNRESVYFDNISWYGHGHVARSIRDPRKVFDRLFAIEQQTANGSILDLVMEDARTLNSRLGRLDRHKLDEYMHSIRTVEQQIERVTSRQTELNQLDLQRPVKTWQVMKRDEFIQVMGDLMILALRTDLTRVSTLMSSPERWGSPLKVDGLFDDKPIQHHGWTHNQSNPNVKRDLERLDRFHIEQFAALAAKMDAIPDGNGTLLDNMMFVLGSGISDGSLHVYTDLPTIVAGSASGQIKTNRHDKHPPGTPIANLWLSMAQLMGVSTDRIGDSTGPLQGLLA
jgi:hypothetical protein